MKDFIRQIEQIQLLNKLITNRRTGNPRELANRLGISRSQLYLIIEYLKDMGLKISFSRKFNSFFYEEDCSLHVEFNLKVMSSEEVGNISGGKISSTNTAHPFFWTPQNYF